MTLNGALKTVAVVLAASWFSQLPYLWPLPPELATNWRQAMSESYPIEAPNWAAQSFKEEVVGLNVAAATYLDNPELIEVEFWWRWSIQVALIVLGAGLSIIYVRKPIVTGVFIAALGLYFVWRFGDPRAAAWLWEDAASLGDISRRLTLLREYPATLLTILHLHVVLPAIYLCFAVATIGSILLHVAISVRSKNAI